MIDIPEPTKPSVAPHYSQNSISHVSVPVQDMKRSIAFYDDVLATLGMTRLKTLPQAAGYGTMFSWGFWIHESNPATFKPINPGSNRYPGVHICLQAPSREAVNKFYEVALQHGATDDGKPGIRDKYTPDYYAAYVIDPDGWKIEALHMEPWFFVFFRAAWPTVFFLLGATTAIGLMKYFS